MGLCVRQGLLIAGLLGALTLLPERAGAQSIRVQETGTPLAEAVDRLAEQSGVDIVYAQYLVEGVSVNCSYRGDRVLAALRCLLVGTRLDARSTGPGQFVLVAAAPPRRQRAVTGLVTDAESGAALAGAHVYLPDQARGAIANRTGFFSFPEVGGGLHRVRVSYLGYAVLDTLVAARPEPARLPLRQIAIRSQDILVEAPEPRPGDRTPLPGMTAPPVAELERLPASLGGQDLLEALTWLPGIRRAGEVTGGLVVRGAGPDQNLYLLDGAPVYHPWHAFSLISTFQTETFRSARLYRGAFPAAYGGRLSAVLDAELSDGRGTEPRARAAVNTHSGRFLIETPIGRKSSFMLGGRRSYVDKLIGREHPVRDDFGRRDTLRTGYFFYDWTAKLVFRPDAISRVAITSYRGLDDLDLRLPFDLSLDLSSWLRPTDLYFEIGQRWRNRLVSVRYERLLSPQWYITATGYDTRYQAREGAYLRPTLSSDVTSSYGVDIRDLGLRVDLDYFHSDRHEAQLGWQVAARDFDSDLQALVRYNRDLSEALDQVSTSRAVEFSLYAQDTWKARPNLDIVTGIRAVAFGSDRLVRLEPRSSFQWAVHPRRLLVRGSFTRTYQYLHRIRDRHSFLYDIVSARWIPSDHKTSPAKGTEVALDLESRPGVWSIRAGLYGRRQDRILLPSDVFQSKDDLAGPGIEVGTLLGQYVPGEARSVGIELSASYASGPWYGRASLATERSRSRSPETQGFRPTRYDVPRSMRSFGEYRWRTWRFGAGLTLRSGYPITVPVSRYTLEGPLSQNPVTYLHRPEVHNGRLPTYYRLDLQAARTFRWLEGTWRVQLQLYNATGRRNVIDRLYEPAGTSVRSVDRRGLPILPLFELEVVL